ncbi:MAG TPA: ABC transporter permease [Candidatus Ventrousia excrementavium]|uniref:ABC transporter permease n=1 Tax=Candidatus Ventrousia excrementavium TaxID=2840961 RepID=A0A9D1LK06_9CLOT|nr:ABC transporter permease [Candidatus Ventrousia excrementavium]
MGRYYLSKLGQALVTIVLVVLVVFTLLRFMPTTGYFSKEEYKEMTETERNAYLRSIGVLDPTLVQLKNFVVKLFHGDLGRSITVYPKSPITEVLGDKIKYTVLLNVFSLILSYAAGLSLGVAMARYKGRLVDHLGTAYVIAIRSIPSIIILFFVQVGLSKLLDLPMMFYMDQPLSWILPVISLSLSSIAGTAIWLRRYIVDEENRDYIKFARAKGLSQNYIMVRHVFRNAIVPIAINFPSDILLLISGGLITESLYSVPGMGGLLIQSIRALDNNLVQVLVLIFSTLSVFGVFLGDIFVSFVDPRIKLTADPQ